MSILLACSSKDGQYPSYQAVYNLCTDFKKVFAQSKKIGSPMLITYPSNPKDLPQCTFTSCYGDAPPISISMPVLMEIANHVPLRSTSRLLRNPNASPYIGGGDVTHVQPPTITSTTQLSLMNVPWNAPRKSPSPSPTRSFSFAEQLQSQVDQYQDSADSKVEPLEDVHGEHDKATPPIVKEEHQTDLTAHSSIPERVKSFPKTAEDYEKEAMLALKGGSKEKKKQQPMKRPASAISAHKAEDDDDDVSDDDLVVAPINKKPAAAFCVDDDGSHDTDEDGKSSSKAVAPTTAAKPVKPAGKAKSATHETHVEDAKGADDRGEQATTKAKTKPKATAKAKHGGTAVVAKPGGKPAPCDDNKKGANSLGGITEVTKKVWTSRAYRQEKTVATKEKNSKEKCSERACAKSREAGIAWEKANSA